MLCLFLPYFFLLIFRFRFTIAKVQHLEIPIAVFCCFLLFLHTARVLFSIIFLAYLAGN